MINIKDEIMLATDARTKAYAPHSGYTVGAALRCKNGKRYYGCNIENAGIQSICAERTAFVKAISEGEREFDCIVVIGGAKDKAPEQCLPCGYCRQFMSEFVDENFKIYTVYDKKVEEYTMKELLPYGFKL
jgi:cytidine deaminase